MMSCNRNWRSTSEFSTNEISESAIMADRRFAPRDESLSQGRTPDMEMDEGRVESPGEGLPA